MRGRPALARLARRWRALRAPAALRARWRSLAARCGLAWPWLLRSVGLARWRPGVARARHALATLTLWGGRRGAGTPSSGAMIIDDNRRSIVS